MDPLSMIAYVVLLVLALVLGDKLGCLVSRMVIRGMKRQMPSLPIWLDISIAVLVPVLVLSGLAVVSFRRGIIIGVDRLSYDVEAVLVLAFFVTGLIGGFLVSVRKR